MSSNNNNTQNTFIPYAGWKPEHGTFEPPGSGGPGRIPNAPPTAAAGLGGGGGVGGVGGGSGGGYGGKVDNQASYGSSAPRPPQGSGGHGSGSAHGQGYGSSHGAATSYTLPPGLPPGVVNKPPSSSSPYTPASQPAQHRPQGEAASYYGTDTTLSPSYGQSSQNRPQQTQSQQAHSKYGAGSGQATHGHPQGYGSYSPPSKAYTPPPLPGQPQSHQTPQTRPQHQSQSQAHVQQATHAFEAMSLDHQSQRHQSHPGHAHGSGGSHVPHDDRDKYGYAAFGKTKPDPERYHGDEGRYDDDSAYKRPKSPKSPKKHDKYDKHDKHDKHSKPGKKYGSDSDSDSDSDSSDDKKKKYGQASYGAPVGGYGGGYDKKDKHKKEKKHKKHGGSDSDSS